MPPKPNLIFVTSVTLKIKAWLWNEEASPQGPIVKLYTKYQYDSCESFWVIAWKRLYSERQTDRWTDRQTNRQHHKIICPLQDGHIKTHFHLKNQLCMKFHYKCCLHLGRQPLPTTHINLTASKIADPIRYGLQLFKSNIFRKTKF